MTAFTDAIRAVLTEIDIDNLPLPISIRPDDPLEVQVRPRHFDRWASILTNAVVTTGATVRTPAGIGVKALKASGTVSGHRVLLVAIKHEVAEAQMAAEYDTERGHHLPREERAAVAREGFARRDTGTEYDLYADKDRGTALADQHIAEMKATAFGGGER